jgi:hypothetical protein
MCYLFYGVTEDEEHKNCTIPVKTICSNIIGMPEAATSNMNAPRELKKKN